VEFLNKAYRNFYEQHSAQEIKAKYKEGTKIRLIKMEDIQAPPLGTTGIVQFVDDAGQIHCNWPNGSTLALIANIEKFEIIE